MVNAHCPEPLAPHAPLPPLAWEDKWRLFARKKAPGVRDKLAELLTLEQQARRGARARARARRAGSRPHRTGAAPRPPSPSRSAC